MDKNSQSKFFPLFLISLILSGILFICLVMAQEEIGGELNEDNVTNYIAQDGISIIKTSLRSTHYTGEYRILSQDENESDYNITFENVKKGNKDYVLIEFSSNSEVPDKLPLYKNKNKIKKMDLNKSKKGNKNVFSYYADPNKDFHLKFGENSIIIIQISSAEHLNKTKWFISDIYNEVKELDGIWSEEIPDSHYVRVVFEQNLTNENDITIYPNIINGTPRIEVYEVDGTEIIAEFNPIESNQYNKVYLNGLQGIQDTFDLKIIGGNVRFDHIVDPLETLFFEDWEAGDFNDWDNTNWDFDVDYDGDSGNSVKCAGIATCDMWTIVSSDTSDATKINLTFYYNDDDCDAGDVILYANDTYGNWDSLGNIDAGSMGKGDDAWYGIIWQTNDPQYFHSGFSVRFWAGLEARENYWLDDINVTMYSVVEVKWNQSSLDMGSGDIKDGNLTRTVKIESISANNNVNVSCSGNCSNIITNWTDRNMVNGQNDTVLITCLNTSVGTFQATFNVTSDEDDSDNLITVECEIFTYGWLNVSIQKPDDNSNWYQNETNLTINATVTCEGGTGAICGTVEALARYGSSSPDTAVNTTKGDLPFYISDEALPAEGDYDGNWSITAANTNPTGIAQNGTYIWINDNVQTNVYKYWANGTYIETYEVGSQMNLYNGVGLTTDNNFIWGMNYAVYEVYKYYMNMTYTGESFDTSGDGENIRGITNNGSHFWITGLTNQIVNQYTLVGVHTGNSWDVSSEITQVYGITTDNNYIWVQCVVQNKTFKYYMNMTYTGESWATRSASEDGLEQNGTHFLMNDGVSDVVHLYNMFFPTGNPQSTTLAKDESYQFNWTLNVTTADTESYLIDVNFTSSYGNALIPDNDTADRTVNLNPSVEAFFMVELRYPINWTNTTDTTPNFEFNSTGSESSYACELFLNDTGYGTDGSTSNATNINITANASLDGIYNWNINCTANSVTNISEIRVINVSVTDTCTYPGSGTWNVDCDDYCNISLNVDLLGNDIYITGTGRFTTTANITNWNDRYIIGTDSSNRCLVYSLAGGGFGP